MMAKKPAQPAQPANPFNPTPVPNKTFAMRAQDIIDGKDEVKVGWWQEPEHVCERCGDERAVDDYLCDLCIKITQTHPYKR